MANQLALSEKGKYDSELYDAKHDRTNCKTIVATVDEDDFMVELRHWPPQVSSDTESI